MNANVAWSTSGTMTATEALDRSYREIAYQGAYGPRNRSERRAWRLHKGLWPLKAPRWLRWTLGALLGWDTRLTRRNHNWGQIGYERRQRRRRQAVREAR